jgi:ABC-type branched-subunit amino acid transport system ATPase component
MSQDALLEIEDVSVSFGGVQAVKGFHLALPSHSRMAIIGPNGAGKSTVINLIAGAAWPDRGDIRLDGRSMRRVSAHGRARRGIARTFQNLELFLSMSVLDNVLAALDSEARLFGSRSAPRRPLARRARARAALALFEIEGYADAPAGVLPYGVRKLVELSRALVTEPRLLLLDEPVAGLDDTDEFVAMLVHALDQRDSSVLLVEHDMPTVRTLSERVHVLDSGELIAEGSYEEVSRHPRVIEAYLGAAA